MPLSVEVPVFAESGPGVLAEVASDFGGSPAFVVEFPLESAAFELFASAPAAAPLSVVVVLESSVAAGLAGAGSPGFTVSTTAGEVLPVPEEPLPPGDATSEAPPLPASVSVPELSDSGSICGVP